MVDRDQLRTPSHSVTQPIFRALACTCIVCWTPWCFMVAELCSRPYTHVLPGMFRLHGSGAVLRHHNNQGISVCNLLGNCDGTGAASRTESRTPSTRFLDCGLGHAVPGGGTSLCSACRISCTACMVLFFGAAAASFFSPSTATGSRHCLTDCVSPGDMQCCPRLRHGQSDTPGIGIPLFL